MDEQKQGKKTSPPYVSYQSFVNFLADIRDDLPLELDRSALKDMNGATYSALIPSLRYLGLLGAGLEPTPGLESLAKSEGEERQAMLRKILERSYPYLFDNFDLARATPDMLHKKFKEQGVGGETVRKAEAFFLRAVKDAGIAMNRRLQLSSRGVDRSPAPRPPKQQKRGAKNTNASSYYATAEQTDGQSGLGRFSEILRVSDQAMSKLPSFDPNWSAEAQANYIRYVKEIMGFARDMSGLAQQDQEAEGVEEEE